MGFVDVVSKKFFNDLTHGKTTIFGIIWIYESTFSIMFYVIVKIIKILHQKILMQKVVKEE